MESDKRTAVTAKYTAPSAEPQVLQQNLTGCPSNPSTEQRTAYLSELRTSISQIQADINVFLTQKMEEDKSKAVQSNASDEKEEENYGEEAVDEEG
jgi:Gon7 family